MKHDLRHYLAKNMFVHPSTCRRTESDDSNRSFVTTSGFYSDPGMTQMLVEMGADNILCEYRVPGSEKGLRVLLCSCDRSAIRGDSARLRLVRQATAEQQRQA